MENHFTEADILVLEKEICFKSYKDIAFLIDKSLEDLTKFLDGWLPGKGLIPFQLLLNQKAVNRPVRVREKKQTKKKPVILSRMILPDKPGQTKRRNALGETKYRTRKVDYSKKQMVRIDDKTWIYINEGEDPVKARIIYLKKLSEHNSSLMAREQISKEVKKF